MSYAKVFLREMAFHCTERRAGLSEVEHGLALRKAKIAERIADFVNESTTSTKQQNQAVENEIDRLLDHAYRKKFDLENAGIIALANLINTFK